MTKKTPIAADNPMRDLYERLNRLGFGTKWLRDHILPDWWEDEMAAIPSTRTQIEILLSRQLGLALASVRDPNQALCFEPTLQAAYKHRSNIEQPTLEVAHSLASRLALIAAHTIVRPVLLKDTKGKPWTAATVRAHILKKGKKWVGLEELLEFCWEIGVPVILMNQMPQGHKKLDGIAAWVGERPIIICSCRQPVGAWLLFIVAHELGHLLLGHVPMGEIFVEGNLSSGVEPNSKDDENEGIANQFATELITGEITFRYSQKSFHTPFYEAPQLVEAAMTEGEEWDIHPGALALNYGHHERKMGLGNKAAGLLKDHLGEASVSDVFCSFYSQLALDRLPYESVSIFERLTGCELSDEG